MICVIRDNDPPSIRYFLIKSEPQERPPAQDDINMEDNHDSSRQPTFEPSETTFFEGATNIHVADGGFTAVAGSVIYPGAQPLTCPAPRPQQQQNVSYFKNSSGSVVTGGDFIAVGGSVYGSPPPQHFPQRGSELGCPVCFVILT